MFPLSNLPIRRKLTLIILLTSTIALLLVTVAMAVYGIGKFRQTLVRELSTEAEIVAFNSAAALAFSDAEAAHEILTALQAQPGIVHACLFDRDGKVFSEFRASKDRLPVLTNSPTGYRFEGGYVLVFRQVKFGEDIVGSIALRSDLSEQKARLQAAASIALVAFLAALFVSLILSIKLQKIISVPVLELAAVAHQVTLAKDYSLRATKRSNDEIGVLMEEFNQMLAQIEKSDADLRLSEARFRQMAESIHEVFWLTDLDKKEVFYVSPSYEKIWGHPCADVHSWIDSIHESDRARIMDAAVTKQANGAYDEEYRIVRPDGTIRWIHDRGFPVLDSDGKIYRVAGIAEDITKRKDVEKALRRAEANYRSIFENALEGIFQTTPEGRFLAANFAMARILGYASPEELISNVTNVGEQLCVDPASRGELGRQLEKKGEVQEFENELYRKDGSRIWVSVNVRVERDSQGAVLRYEGTTYDITERKRVEETLRKTEQLYRQAITGAGAVPYVSEYETRTYLYMGEGIEQLIGYKPHEIRGELWKQIIQETVMIGQAAGLPPEEAGGRMVAGEIQMWQSDLRVTTRDGQTRWISDVSVPNLDESGRLIGSMGILQDITERKQAEKKNAAFSIMASRLSAATSPEEAARAILDTVSELFEWDCGFVHLYDREQDRIVPILTYDIIDGKRGEMRSQDFDTPSSLTRFVVENGSLLIDGRDSLPVATSPFGDKARLSSSMMYALIRQSASVVGILSIQSYTPHQYQKEDLNLLEALANHCSGALQRIRMTEELREAEAKYRAIFEDSTEGIFQTTADGNYLSANPALARIFGYESPEEMIESVTDIQGQTYVLPEKRNEFKRLCEIHVSVQNFEVERYRKDGSAFWLSVNGRAVRDAKGTVLYYEGTSRDITARRHLEKQLIEISDREQSRMGQDLHDGLCQHLVRTAFAANLLEKDLSKQSLAHVDQAKKVARLVDDAITQSRNLARGLYPVKLEVEGFHSAMQELAANIRVSYNLICEFESSSATSISDHALATHLYRIAQEAAINAAKHAKPQKILIRLNAAASRIQLTVIDDGAGIGVSTSHANGMGLHIMNYRARMIGAALKIEPRPNGGTIVSCIFEHRTGSEKTTNPQPNGHEN